MHLILSLQPASLIVRAEMEGKCLATHFARAAGRPLPLCVCSLRTSQTFASDHARLTCRVPESALPRLINVTRPCSKESKSESTGSRDSSAPKALHAEDRVPMLLPLISPAKWHTLETRKLSLFESTALARSDFRCVMDCRTALRTRGSPLSIPSAMTSSQKPTIGPASEAGTCRTSAKARISC